MWRRTLAIFAISASIATAIESAGCGPAGGRTTHVSEVASADSEAYEKARKESDRFYEQKKAEEAKSRSRTRRNHPVPE
jgi:hypothetical protein